MKSSMKALNIILLVVGIILLLATEGQTATPNIIGLVLFLISTYKLKVLTL